jgi:hypothetical protein
VSAQSTASVTAATPHIEPVGGEGCDDHTRGGSQHHEGVLGPHDPAPHPLRDGIDHEHTGERAERSGAEAEGGRAGEEHARHGECGDHGECRHGAEQACREPHPPGDSRTEGGEEHAPDEAASGEGGEHEAEHRWFIDRGEVHRQHEALHRRSATACAAGENAVHAYTQEPRRAGTARQRHRGGS